MPQTDAFFFSAVLRRASGSGGEGPTSHAAVTHPRLLLQWVVKLHARHATPATLHALLRCLRDVEGDHEGFAEDSHSHSHTRLVDDVESQQAFSTLVLEVRVCELALNGGSLREIPTCMPREVRRSDNASVETHQPARNPTVGFGR